MLHTVGGEWYSNVDIAPSHSDNTLYAENFKAAADEIFGDTKSAISKDPNALLLISGHSRGGSVANLLGLLYNGTRSTSLNYIYPIAPALTLHTPADSSVQVPTYYTANIFNVVNSADLVTVLPLKSMGFYRPGSDVVINAASGLNKLLTKTEQRLSEVCSSVSSYYNDRHSLNSAGLSDDGMTVYELMNQAVVSAFMPGASSTNIMDNELVQMVLGISSRSDFAPIKDIATDVGLELMKEQFGITPSPTNSYTGMLATHEAASYLAALEAMAG